MIWKIWYSFHSSTQFFPPTQKMTILKYKFYIINQETKSKLFLVFTIKLDFNMCTIFLWKQFCCCCSSTWVIFFFFFIGIKFILTSTCIHIQQNVLSIFVKSLFTHRYFLEVSTTQIFLQKQFSADVQQNWCS